MGEPDHNEENGSAVATAGFDNDIYTNLSIAAKLRDIRLISCEYVIKPEVFEALEDTSNMSFSGEPTAFHFDDDSGVMIGHYTWNVEIKLKRKKVLKLIGEYLIAYTDISGFPEEYVRFYFVKVGRFATYPYFRTAFSFHSSSSGITLPPLPSLNERVD